MRTFAAILALCGLVACSSEAQPQPQLRADPAEPAAATPSPAPDEVRSALAALPPSDEHDLPPRASAALEALGSETGDDPDSDSESETGESGAELPAAGETDHADNAPLLPEAPEPGSAAADAELLALLDETELTQDEFAQGFGRDGPRLDNDQFEFGPNARKRGTPVVLLGAVEGPGAKGLAALVEAERRKFEGCLAMGLSKDEAAMGTLSLRLSFDAKGSVSAVTTETEALGGAEAVQTSLTTCLASIPTAWELAAAASSSVRLPLTLTIEES